MPLPPKYAHYKKEFKGTLDSKTFHQVCKEYNRGLLDKLLEGKEVVLGPGLSTLRIIKKKNRFKRPSINWKASLEYRDELLAQGEALHDPKTGKGIKWFIYYMPEYLMKYRWYNRWTSTRNVRVYRFYPARSGKPGGMGATDRLGRLLNSDDLAYLRFKTEQYVSTDID